MPLDRAAAAEHHAFAAALCRQVLGARIDAVFGNDPGGAGLAAALTAAYRADEPRYPNVRHVLVDRARTRVPVSARQVRRDVHAHRSYLSPQVYASFVERVCLLGAESSGKTTLARRLAQHFDTTWVREYGRELWQTSGGALQQDDLRRIAEIQVAREEAAAPRARRFLFCDTSPLTALFYSQRWFGRVDPVLRALAARPYDHVVLCAPDFPFVQDGTRQGPRARDRQHGWYAAELARREITPFVARGTRDERVASIAAWLQRLRREAG
jgi:NadR type nicotinamide-nucleotide adenylyltransferase